MREQKQTRHLKLIKLAGQICSVLSVAFVFGFFFCVFELFFGYDIDGFIVLMLMFICGLGVVAFGLIEVEMRERFDTERDAMLAENIYYGIKKSMLDDMYEKEN